VITYVAVSFGLTRNLASLVGILGGAAIFLLVDFVRIRMQLLAALEILKG